YWDLNTSVPALMRLRKVKSLRVAYSLSGDRRDAGFLRQAHAAYDDNGGMRPQIFGAPQGGANVFANWDPSMSENLVIRDVVNAAELRAMAVQTVATAEGMPMPEARQEE